MKRIDVLPDDVLLEIFDFYVNMSPRFLGKMAIEGWQTLVHVCRRWRSLVLGSPRRLNLRLFCTNNTPTRDKLDIWPALPLVIQADLGLSTPLDDILAAFGQRSRVCEVDLSLTGWGWEDVLAAMQVPFPELTDLKVVSCYEPPLEPVIPDSFLGGSAPRLRHLEFDGVTFPGLPKLHLSAPHLVSLTISYIHHSWHIASEAMVALLSGLSSLKTLSLEFESHDSPDSPDSPSRETRRPPPSKRSVIPALTSLYFIGGVEYLENLVTYIDVPRLHTLFITFFDRIDLQIDTPRLTQLINCTPTLRVPHEAHVEFDDVFASVGCGTSKSRLNNLLINILCKEPAFQLLSIGRVCNSLHPLSTVEDLYIEQLVWYDDDIENTLWLELLRPFTAVKNLYLAKEFAPGIAAALQELVGDRIIEVLSNLQNIFVEEIEVEPSGPLQENIGQFVAARQLSGHPISISVWVNAGG